MARNAFGVEHVSKADGSSLAALDDIALAPQRIGAAATNRKGQAKVSLPPAAKAKIKQNAATISGSSTGPMVIGA